MLHIAEDDDAIRSAAGRNLGKFTPHRLRPARNVDALLPEFLLESDMEVRDDERVVRHEYGLIRDRFEVHGGSKGWVRLIPVRTDTKIRRGSEELCEDPSELVRDVHRCESITLLLEGQVSRGSVRERREPRCVVWRHPLRDESRGETAENIARPAGGHPR